MKLPKLSDVSHWLKVFGFYDIAEQMIKAYVVGSVAKGTATESSDLDIAIILPEDFFEEEDPLDVSTDLLNATGDEINWEGRRVDLQVFSENDPRLKEYQKIALKDQTGARK